ncbi:MAG: PorV/PorQ family protein [Ignavibacteriaceae bacterium]|nr:PorV/PorQ family protein [Ignavibacteriaceae bacterium]
MKKFVLVLLVFITAIPLRAQLFPTLGAQRAGISSLQFLKIGVGGRASSMGESFVAVVDDASALYWNPAGLVNFSENQIMFSHNKWFADINHDYLGVVYHLTAEDAIGLSVIALTMDEMKVTTEFAPFGTGEYFTFSDIAVGLSYSRKMTDKFSFGGTLRYVEETLDKLKMRGILIDLGTFYYTGLGTSRFAVAVTNFGNQLAPDGEVSLVGKRKKSDWQSFSPPTMFRVGFAFEPIMEDMQRLTASLQLNHPNDNSENVGVGLEYAYIIPELGSQLFLRGGYKFNVEDQDYSFGAGLKAPLLISTVSVDYAYAHFDRLGAAHRITLSLGI